MGVQFLKKNRRTVDKSIWGQVQNCWVTLSTWEVTQPLSYWIPLFFLPSLLIMWCLAFEWGSYPSALVLKQLLIGTLLSLGGRSQETDPKAEEPGMTVFKLVPGFQLYLII